MITINKDNFWNMLRVNSPLTKKQQKQIIRIFVQSLPTKTHLFKMFKNMDVWIEEEINNNNSKNIVEEMEELRKNNHLYHVDQQVSIDKIFELRRENENLKQTADARLKEIYDCYETIQKEVEKNKNIEKELIYTKKELEKNEREKNEIENEAIELNRHNLFLKEEIQDLQNKILNMKLANL